MKKVKFPHKFEVGDKTFVIQRLSTIEMWQLNNKFKTAFINSQRSILNFKDDVESMQIPDETDVINFVFELCEYVEEVMQDGTTFIPFDAELSCPFPSTVPFEIAKEVLEALGLFDFFTDEKLSSFLSISNILIPDSLSQSDET